MRIDRIDLALVRLPLRRRLAGQRQGVSRPVRAGEAVGKRRHAPRLERLELLAARLHHEIGVVVLGLAHRALPEEPFPLPCCLMYASMKGSIAPSITLCTSVILSSVRWSLTIVYG